MSLKIITHNGSFHADEVFATALIKRFVNPDIEVVRTRDENILFAAVRDPETWVVDVGREYNEMNRNFDHHQASFSKTWPESNIPYSSCGLVWSYLKKKGILQSELSEAVMTIVENKLIKLIDKHDNHVAIWPQSVVFKLSNRNNNQISDFLRALTMAEIHLGDTLYYAEQMVLNINKVDNVQLLENGRIAVVDEEVHNIITPLLHKTNALVLVMPKEEAGQWSIRSIAPAKEQLFAPEEWRGLSGLGLQKVSGINSMVFVHKSGFLTITSCKKDAIKVAKVIISLHH